MPKYHDHTPDGFTISECLDCLDEDFELLADGSWEPDDDSIEASRLMIESIRAKLYGDKDD